MPFWFTFDLSWGTAVYAVALAVLAAVIMGVLPGLRTTGSGFGANLGELNDRSAPRLGRVWTTLVIAQVAAAVAVLPVAVYLAWQVVQIEARGRAFAAGQFFIGTAVLTGEDAGAQRIGTRLRELVSRLEAEPGVSAVSVSSSAPRFAPDRRVEIEGALEGKRIQEVNAPAVDVDFLKTYGAVFLAGRGFRAGDAGANVVVVDETFAREVFGGGAALGARLRDAGDGGSPAEWMEIIGIVRDFPGFAPAPGSGRRPVMYRPAALGDLHPAVVSVRFNGEAPASFADTLRRLAADVDPSLQIRRPTPLTAYYGEMRSLWRSMAWAVALITAAVLLLSAAGIYALLSFTVTQRTREIGIRTALGAPRGLLLLGIFKGVLRQLAMGIATGSLLSGAVFVGAGLELGRAVVLLASVAAIMTAVALAAAFGPTRRSLRMEPVEALKASL